MSTNQASQYRSNQYLGDRRESTAASNLRENTAREQATTTQTTYYPTGSTTHISEVYTPTSRQGAQHTATHNMTPMERWANETPREGYWNSEAALAFKVSPWGGKHGGNNL
ncbi:MAG: hypothetical protein M1813_008497 [Trichoglossum hirsutum]|nr:MAG: hypothetical protein M1813_008497 [Trichoglossum hirsutum]